MQHPKRSPWGTVETVHPIIDGVVSVSTPGHGGLKLDRKRNRAVPERFRRAGGWYEEDVDWAIPVLVFASEMPERDVEAARSTARNWLPEAFEAITGSTVSVADSHVLQERAFRAATRDRFVGCAALGLDGGQVRVLARRASTGEQADFLVDRAEYRERPRHGFVIDEGKHVREHGRTSLHGVAS